MRSNERSEKRDIYIGNWLSL